jgi:hypothetical protein
MTKEGEEGTYKIRKLTDGTKHEVFKNYYSKDEINKLLDYRAKDLKIHIGECFWWITYIEK